MGLALYLARVRSNEVLDDELCESCEEQTTLLSAAILGDRPEPTIAAEIEAYRPLERHRFSITNVTAPADVCSHVVAVE